MKKIIHTFIALLMSACIYAQAPESFKYQAVARNETGDVIANQIVGMQVSILKGSVSGTSAYIETSTSTTNQFGLTHDDLQLFDASTLYFGYHLFIHDSNGQVVLFSNTDYLDLTAWFDVTLRNGKETW